MSTELQTQVRNHIASGKFKVPTLPVIATQALVLAQNEDSTSAQLAALICKDQALAANLLRLANSSAYSTVVKIVSLQQAVTRLGMNTIAELAITICVKGNVFGGRMYQDLTKELWSHALATALFAKEVARQQRHNIESAYLCGLLHRVGMPIVLKALTDICPRAELPSNEGAYELLEALHVEAGLAAVEQWNLPAQVAVAVKNSKMYEEAKQHRNLAALVHLSSALASAMFSEDTEDDTLTELPVLEELSIYPDHLVDIRKHEERISAAVAA
jgi:HD-like signal output (HDOD) protein